MIESDVINTSADSKYFSRALNLIGSIRRLNGQRYSITLWDIGLTNFQIGILKQLKINVESVPKFCNHAYDCFTWKLYVINFSKDQIFLHLDAGNTVIGDIQNIFECIKKQRYFLIDQGQKLQDIAPPKYLEKHRIEDCATSLVFAAGNIGLNKNDPLIQAAIFEAYKGGLEGLTLGYSASELYKSTNNRTNIERECKVFRHDQTLLNCAFRKYIPDLVIHDHSKYAALDKSSSPVILNNRRLKYTHIIYTQYLRLIYIMPYITAIDLYNVIKSRLAKLSGFMRK